MQQRIVGRTNPDSAVCNAQTHMLLDREEREGFTTDFTTHSGRLARSARNIEYLRKQEHDCPDALFEELTNAIKARPYSLRFDHSADDTDSIREYGKILSNRALQEAKIANDRGGTGMSVGIDESYFANRDFVFTWADFTDSSNTPRVENSTFILPKTNLIETHQAWMSLQDWADYSSNTTDPHIGNHMTSEKAPLERRSYVADFYYGEDIYKAIALKTFEAIKTFILINANESAIGFDYDKTKDLLGYIAKRKPMCPNGNGLENAISDYALNEKQLAFINTPSCERGELIQTALERMLVSVRRNAELKVPGYVSLPEALTLPART